MRGFLFFLQNQYRLIRTNEPILKTWIPGPFFAEATKGATSPGRHTLDLNNPPADLLPDLFHVRIEEEKIMERKERATRDLLSANEVRDIITSVLSANETLAGGIYGAFVFQKRGLAEINAALPRECYPPARVVRGNRTIKRIDAGLHY